MLAPICPYQTRDIHLYVCELSNGTALTFTGDGETLRDEQTDSV